MLKILLFIIIAGILVYLLLKFCLYLYRPFHISKTFLEIEQKYKRLLTAIEKNLDSWVETLEKYRSGDKIVRTEIGDENEIMKRYHEAKAEKTHEEEMYGKFLRLRERFFYPLNPEKLTQSVMLYQRYLKIKLQQRQNASIYGDAIIMGAMSFDEIKALADETKIILDDCEEKIDILLAN
jgi:hypothetical protein